MFEKRFKFSNGIEKAFDIACFRDNDYFDRDNRLLIVIGHIPSEDLKNKELLSNQDNRYALISCLKKAKEIAINRGAEVKSFSYAIVNFLASKHYDLENTLKAEKEVEFTARLQALIKKLKPTHVLLLSPLAAENLFSDIPNIRHKLGWVFDRDNIKYVATLDLYQLISDNRKNPGSNVLNTVGFIFQHIANLMQEKNPYSLEGMPFKPVYINTVDKFDRMMRFLEVQDYVAVDTETKNLSVLNNSIYTIQFAGNKSDKGFLLALDHPKTPWTSDEIHYFKKRLRKFFMQKSGPTLVTFNGMFDLRVIRQALKLPIIMKSVWEITAGEHLLDENVNDLSEAIGQYKNKTRALQGNLRATLCRYNNDFYFQNAFTKEDRNTAGEISPDDKDFVRYGCMDVVCLIGILRMQIKRAKDILWKDKSYCDAFIKHMTYQMSDTVHTLSHLKEDGSYINMDYMKVLVSKQSPIVQKLSEVENELNAQAEVREANKILTKNLGFTSSSLFGSKTTNSWVFSWTKPVHKSLLFFDTMHMKPVSETASGAPAIDRTFISTYENSNRIVSLYSEYQKLNKMLSSYIKGWYKILTTDIDSACDNKLRPDYSFYNVTTGRLASHNPSLQVIPQHSDISDILKEAFVAPPGHILLHYDYSAQEVRTWGIVSKDDTIAGTFRQGQSLRKIFIKDPSQENLDNVKKKGDVHILNVKLFFNKDIDKKHPLRHAIKAVVFGTLYGKSAKTLGDDIKQPAKMALRARIREAFKLTQTSTGKELQKAEKEFNTAQKELDDLNAEDKTDYAQSIIDKMFSLFKRGKVWTDVMKTNAEKKGYVYSPIGRIRHLPSVFVSDKSTIAKQVRRGSNAPIQGFASEIAVKACRLSLETYFKELKTFKEILGIEDSAWDLKPQCCRIVHDASYYAVPYCMLLPFLHIMQYMATYGVAQDYYDKFGFKFNIEPEIEVEMAARDNKGYTWNWSISNLISCIDNTIDDLISNNACDKDGNKLTKEELRSIIYKPYRNKKMIHYLQSKYPLLGVNDLEEDLYKACN